MIDLLKLKHRPPLLRRGSSGTWVKCLQEKLGKVVVDGAFGFKTRAAVRRYQSTCKLTPDGIVGPHTWSYLAIAPQKHSMSEDAVRLGVQLAYEGVGESGGNNRGPWISRFMNGENKGEPWCVGFATFLYSSIPFFKSSGVLYNKYKDLWIQDCPQLGAFVFVKDSKSWSGFRHTAVLTKAEGNYVYVVEGNVRPRKWIPFQRDCVRLGRYHVRDVETLYPMED